MIDHQHLYLINNTTTISSTTCSDRKLFDKINSEWRHKSQSDRIRLKEAFENIIYDMNQHKQLRSSPPMIMIMIIIIIIITIGISIIKNFI